MMGFGTFLGLQGSLLAINRFLIHPLQEEGVLSPGLATAAGAATGVGVYAALHRLGLFPQPTGTMLRAFPTFSGYHVLANAFLSELGLPADSILRDIGSVGLALGAERLAGRLPAPVNAMANGAARCLGTLSLINMGSGLVEDIVAPIVVDLMHDGDHDRHMRSYRITRMSQELLNQKNTGELAAGVFGTLMTFSDTIRSWVDDDFKTNYWNNVHDSLREIVAQAQSIDTWLNKSLLLIVMAHAQVDAASGRITHVDWEAVRADVASFYRNENARPVIASWYRLTREATADQTTGSELIDVVDVGGEIADLTAFQTHVYRSLATPFVERLRRFRSEGIDVFLSHAPGPLSFDLEAIEPEAAPISLNEAGRRTLNEMGAMISLHLYLENLR